MEHRAGKTLPCSHTELQPTIDIADKAKGLRYPGTI